MSTLKSKKYLLDANIFIEASKRYYSFDIAPGFWKNIIKYDRAGVIFSVDRVKKELERKDDEIKTWIDSNLNNSFFVPTDNPNIFKNYAQVQNWANSHSQFTDAAKSIFAQADEADAWLIATAITNSYVIVTEETIDRTISNKIGNIKIPNVCENFKLEYINTFQMLRELQIELK